MHMNNKYMCKKLNITALIGLLRVNLQSTTSYLPHSNTIYTFMCCSADTYNFLPRINNLCKRVHSYIYMFVLHSIANVLITVWINEHPKRHTRPFSTHLVSITIDWTFCSQTTLHRSSRVLGSGPCATMYSLFELYPYGTYSWVREMNIVVKHTRVNITTFVWEIPLFSPGSASCFLDKMPPFL